MRVIGTYEFLKTSLDNEANTLLTYDWSKRHEIAAGATISVYSFRVLKQNAASTDFTLSGATVNAAGTVSSVAPRETRAR